MKIFGIDFEVADRNRGGGGEPSAERENYLSFILDKVPVGIMQTGLDGHYRYVNSRFCELVGRPREELVGLHFQRITHPDDVAENERLFAAALDTGAPYTFRKRYLRPDGTAVWTEVTVTMLSERHEGLLSVVVDLTDRMHAEAQKNLLIAELNHRVKNTLAAVQSLAQMTMKHTASPKTFNDAFSARLIALSTTHNLLTRAAWERASLLELVEAEIEPYAGREHARVEVSGPAVDLSPKQAISLGLVFHELVTNAAKYGALAIPEGKVLIAWHTVPEHEGRSLRIAWREQGGPAVKTPSHQGFGSRLIERSIAHELGGQIELAYPAEGFRCGFAVPL